MRDERGHVDRGGGKVAERALPGFNVSRMRHLEAELVGGLPPGLGASPGQLLEDFRNSVISISRWLEAGMDSYRGLLVGPV